MGHNELSTRLSLTVSVQHCTVSSSYMKTPIFLNWIHHLRSHTYESKRLGGSMHVDFPRVQELTRSNRRMQAHQQRLVVDVLGVASRIRPAAMLEYASWCRPYLLARMCMHVSTARIPGLENLRLCALVWQDCRYIVNLEVLDTRLERISVCNEGSPPEIQFIKFGYNGRGNAVSMFPCSACEVCAFFQQLLCLIVNCAPR
jgi:hypothetical protein